jgi:hypothetical protein
MATVYTWLDRWVQEERNVPRSASRYPDDVDYPPGFEPPVSCGDTAVVGAPVGSGSLPAASSARGVDSTAQSAALGEFRQRTRGRRELLGLSLADLSALGGASEERSAGCLSIRDDLPPADYLSVPFVRRAWRLLWLLDDGGGVHFDFCRSSSPEDCDTPPVLQAITFDWRLARSLDMDPRTAHFNLRRLLQILMATGFLDDRDDHGLSPRSYDLIRQGRVGPFYKALMLRLFNRYPWGVHDGLPPLSFVQYNAFFLTWMVTRVHDHPVTAEELQQPLSALAHRLALRSDDINWSDDAHLVARSVQERFLSRIGRMLGLCRRSPGDGIGMGGSYTASSLVERVLRWQL